MVQHAVHEVHIVHQVLFLETSWRKPIFITFGSSAFFGFAGVMPEMSDLCFIKVGLMPFIGLRQGTAGMV
jgi:hypothetical protein